MCRHDILHTPMGPMMRLIRSRVVSPGLDSGEVWLQLPGACGRLQLQMTHEHRTSNMLGQP